MPEKQKRWRLTDLNLDFISLVPAGDDGNAKVVLAKVAPDDEKPNLAELASYITALNSAGVSLFPDEDLDEVPP